MQNIFNKAQFESPKFPHQTTFETLKNYNKPCFECAYLGENVIDLLKQKTAQIVAITFGCFIFSKSHNDIPKVAQSVKNRPIWSPCWQQTI
jgi:hypothetical protein